MPADWFHGVPQDLLQIAAAACALRFGIDLQHHRRFGNNVLHNQNVVRASLLITVPAMLRKLPDTISGSIKVGCAFAARAPGAELIASLDVREWSKFCRVKAC